MDIFDISAYALGGAFGAALGALLTTLGRLRWPPRVTAAASVVPVVVMATVVPNLGVAERLRDVAHPPSRMDLASRKYSRDLEASTPVKRRLEGSADASAAARDLAHAGLRRLSIPELEAWNRLRERLAESSSVVCAGFWTGRVGQAELRVALEALDDAQLDDWFRVSTTAMRLEAESTAALPEDTGLEGLVEELISRMPEGERPRMLAAFDSGVQLGDVDACWAMKTMFQTVAALSGSSREAALRSLAAL